MITSSWGRILYSKFKSILHSTARNIICVDVDEVVCCWCVHLCPEWNKSYFKTGPVFVSSPSAPPLNFKVLQRSVPAIKSAKICPVRCHTSAPSVTGNFEMEAVWKARQLRGLFGKHKGSLSGVQERHRPLKTTSAEAPHPDPFPPPPAAAWGNRRAEASKCFSPSCHSVMRRSFGSCWEVCLEVMQVWLRIYSPGYKSKRWYHLVNLYIYCFPGSLAHVFIHAALE